MVRSNMLGSNSGVATKLKESFPRIIIRGTWHCFNHRLGLSVCDAEKCCSAVNHFKVFIECLYSMSPKCQRELAEYASKLDVQLNRIGCILSVRWVASSYDNHTDLTVRYQALHLHFTRKASDPLTESREKVFRLSQKA